MNALSIVDSVRCVPSAAGTLPSKFWLRDFKDMRNIGNKLPTRVTVHRCTQMYVSVSSQSGSRNQELGSQAALRVAQDFLMSLFPGLLNDHFKGQLERQVARRDTGDRVMSRHPTRDSLDLVATIRWFLHDDSDRNMITRYGPLTKVVRNLRVTVKVEACHRRQYPSLHILVARFQERAGKKERKKEPFSPHHLL